MPDISENQPKTATPKARREEEMPTTQATPSAEDSVGAPTTLSRKGAFFRALLKAGCDAEVAHTAVEEARSMAGENVAARIGGQLTDFKQLAALIRGDLRELKELVAEQGESLADHGTQLDVLALRMDGLKTEMRLMWGTLGAPVTVLGVVFHSVVPPLRPARVRNGRGNYGKRLKTFRIRISIWAAAVLAPSTREFGCPQLFRRSRQRWSCPLTSFPTMDRRDAQSKNSDSLSLVRSSGVTASFHFGFTRRISALNDCKWPV